METISYFIWIVLIISTNGAGGDNHFQLSFHDLIPPDQSEVTSQYAFNEMDHRSAILCPEGFFISAMTYFFRIHSDGNPVPVNGSATTLHVKYLIQAYNTKVEEYNTRMMVYGPCSTLLRCLGHQACLFSLSIELCKNDPSPGYRKFLFLNATCSRDDLLEQLLDERCVDKCSTVEADQSASRYVGQTSDTTEVTGGASDHLETTDESSTSSQNTEGGEDTGPGRKMVKNDKDMLRGNEGHCLTPCECESKDIQISRDVILAIQQSTGQVVVIKATNVKREDDVSGRASSGKDQLDLDQVKIGTSVVSNAEVFGKSCPSFDMIHEIGYKGECSRDPPDVRAVVDATWMLLARANDDDCREQLLQVFCSYKYDMSGNCRPPFVVQPEASKDWSYISQPTKGPRPDTTSLNSKTLSPRISVLDSPYKDLIPARLAFIITAHKAPDAVLELLQLVYRRHHYYVIHVDVRKTDTLQEIIKLVADLYNGADNIHVFNTSRSFTSSWGSYGITRTVSEAGEKLLEMGVWDFMLDISGADLPLRDVDDLARMMAPYRGLSYFLTNGKPMNWKTDVGIRSAWHACGGYLYNITARQERPENLYLSSNWAIFSRTLAEFIVHPQADPAISPGFMYYMQTTLISDESYFPTLFMNTAHRDNIRFRGFTLMKPFVGEDSKKLCRRRDETDGCGRGPGVFEPSDIAYIMTRTHEHFFGRKFSTDVSDELRQEIIKFGKSKAYNRENINMLPQHFINATAMQALNYINKRYDSEYDLEAITDLTITPRLSSEDPCCQTVLDKNNYIVQEYVYWLELLLNDHGKLKKARAMVVPSQPIFHSCYGGGHIRAMQLTTRTEQLSKQAPQAPQPAARSNTPMSHEWADARVLWVNLAVHTADNIPRECQEQSSSNAGYVAWPPLDQHKFPPMTQPPPALVTKLPKIKFKFTLHSPDGNTVEKMADISPPYPSGDPKQTDVHVFNQALEFGPFSPGWWKVTVTQVDAKYSHVYEQKILLLPKENLSKADIYSMYITDKHVAKYYKVQAAALLDDLDPRQFYPDMTFDMADELAKKESIYQTKYNQTRTREPQSRQPRPLPRSHGIDGSSNYYLRLRVKSLIWGVVALAVVVIFLSGVTICRTNKKKDPAVTTLTAAQYSHLSLMLTIVILSLLLCYSTNESASDPAPKGVTHDDIL